jgi:hypothetical protein
MPSSFLRKAIVNTAFYGLKSKWRKSTYRTAGVGEAPFSSALTTAFINPLTVVKLETSAYRRLGNGIGRAKASLFFFDYRIR